MNDRRQTEVYLSAKRKICELINDNNAETRVPACPDWNLRQLLAHQVGVLEDFLSGSLEGAPGQRWTATHVARFEDKTVGQIKHAWDEAVTQAGDGLGKIALVIAPDVTVHEFDVRGALGDTSNREAESLIFAGEMLLRGLDGRFREKQLPALRVVSGTIDRVLGDGAVQGELKIGPFEGSRLLTGRRSLQQMRAADWSSDPDVWLDDISLFPPRNEDLIE